MASEGDLATWIAVEETKWRAVPKLGSEWMCKWNVNGRGYWVMLTDGCALWGETRNAEFIQEKAEEWAPCIEAEVQNLSRLVLQDLGQLNVKAEWQGRKQVVLHVSSSLKDLTYKWKFSLIRLHDDVFRQHWVLPLIVQVHSLSQIRKQLTEDVEAKMRYVKELLPDNSKLAKFSKKEVKLEKSVESVMAGGIWGVLQDHLEFSPGIMKLLAVHRSRAIAEEVEKKGKTDTKPTSSLNSSKIPAEEELEKVNTDERLQRVKIQGIHHAAEKSSKQTKKKKLNL